MAINDRLVAQLILLNNALKDFKRAIDADFGKYDELEQNWIKNAQIQKFEFCIELLWKTSKVYFETEGETLLTPKQNIKALFQNSIIDEVIYADLIESLNSRNLLSHVYKLEMFEMVATEITTHYEAMNATYQRLLSRVNS